MTEHTHTWKRSPRKHGNPTRIFVECDCGAKRQASITTGSLVVFDTGREHLYGKTVSVSFRLDKKRLAKLRRLKVDIREVIEKHLDAL